VPIDESKKDFWDSFAEAGAQRQQGQSLMGGRGNSAVGTSAIKKSTGGMGGGRGGGAKKDEWDEW
jgi:ADP-ribosylation factor GTPase-activating protein 1